MKTKPVIEGDIRTIYHDPHYSVEKLCTDLSCDINDLYSVLIKFNLDDYDCIEDFDTTRELHWFFYKLLEVYAEDNDFSYLAMVRCYDIDLYYKETGDEWDNENMHDFYFIAVKPEEKEKLDEFIKTFSREINRTTAEQYVRGKTKMKSFDYSI